MGRRLHTWDYQIEAFCRYKGLRSWLEEIEIHQQWAAGSKGLYSQIVPDVKPSGPKQCI